MTDQSQQDQLDNMVQGLFWWGIPTLFRCPHDPDPANCDIALVGVPHSTGNGTTLHDQHLGPRAVRNVSALGRRVHKAFGLDPWNMARIHDLGDVALPELNDNEASVQRMTDFFGRVDRAGSRPVSIGGDHAITGGILQAIAGPGASLTGGRPASLLHFDAHTDAFDHVEHFFGAKKSAAHWASYLTRGGHVDPHTSVQIGIRGNPRTLDWLEPSYDLGYEVVDIDRFREIGVGETIRIVQERLGDNPVYITFDLDCLDPTVAPGVANIEAGIEGLRVNEVMEVIRSVRGLNVIGGDVACLMPTWDSPNQITAFVAVAVMFEMITLIAERVTDS